MAANKKASHISTQATAIRNAQRTAQADQPMRNPHPCKACGLTIVTSKELQPVMLASAGGKSRMVYLHKGKCNLDA